MQTHQRDRQENPQRGIAYHIDGGIVHLPQTPRRIAENNADKQHPHEGGQAKHGRKFFRRHGANHHSHRQQHHDANHAGGRDGPGRFRLVMPGIFHRRSVGGGGEPVAANQKHGQWPTQQGPEYQAKGSRRCRQLTDASEAEIPLENARPSRAGAVTTGHGHRATDEAVPGLQAHQLGHHYTDQILQGHQHDHQYRKQQHGPAAPS